MEMRLAGRNEYLENFLALFLSFALFLYLLLFVCANLFRPVGKISKLVISLRTALFWVITQRVDININFYGVYMLSALILVRCY